MSEGFCINLNSEFKERQSISSMFLVIFFSLDKTKIMQIFNQFNYPYQYHYQINETCNYAELIWIFCRTNHIPKLKNESEYLNRI